MIEHIAKARIIANPDFLKWFTLQTDVSDVGLGTVLTLEIDGKEHVIAYACRALHNPKLKYTATEKGALALHTVSIR